MNEIQTANTMLPETLPELSKFVLIGREKLTAVRAEIRAIEKVGLAQEVRSQKLKEAQAISEAVLDAEVKIGELMERVPKATPNNNPFHENDSTVDLVKPKAEVIRESGFTPKQIERFQIIAKHPEAVSAAKARARENEEVVTRQSVLDIIKKPHVTFNSENDEWYTPEKYIEAARAVMGGIDIDPASCELANETVKAETYYDKETDGLSQEWYGRVWLNPPYSSALIPAFADKLITSDIEQAIALVNNATDTAWFRKMVERAAAIVFTTGRVRFYKSDKEKGSPLQGQAFLYYGDRVEAFLKVFSEYGWGMPIPKGALICSQNHA